VGVLLLLLTGTTVALAEQPDYFPMQVGNWWEYDVRNQRRDLGTFKVSVVDTTSLNGRSYFLLTGYRWLGTVFLPGNISADTLFVRKEGAKVFFRYFDGQDILFYDFGAREDERWHIPAGWTAEDASRCSWCGFFVSVNWDPELDRKLTPPRGHLFFGFGHDETLGPDMDWVEEFALGIGPVGSIFWSAEDGPRVVTVRRAFINNQELDFDITVIEQRSWGQIKLQFMEHHPKLTNGGQR